VSAGRVINFKSPPLADRRAHSRRRLRRETLSAVFSVSSNIGSPSCCRIGEDDGVLVSGAWFAGASVVKAPATSKATSRTERNLQSFQLELQELLPRSAALGVRLSRCKSVRMSARAGSAGYGPLQALLMISSSLAARPIQPHGRRGTRENGLKSLGTLTRMATASGHLIEDCQRRKIVRIEFLPSLLRDI